MGPLSSKKPSQKRIMGRWKWRQAKGTCRLPRWNAHRRQAAAISIRFNGVFSPIYNWKCVYCFIFPSWTGAANLIDHTESHLMLLITHWLILFRNQGWSNWNSPVTPKLGEQPPHPHGTSLLLPNGSWWLPNGLECGPEHLHMDTEMGSDLAPGTLHPDASHLNGALWAISPSNTAVMSSSVAHTLQMGVRR